MYQKSESDRPKMVGFDLFSMAKEEEIDVWPECVQAFQFFLRLRTQWRVGMAGATGLDYAAVDVLMRMDDVPAEQASSLFEDIHMMEYEALEAMAEQSSNK